MRNEQMFDDIESILGYIPDNFSILEEEVNVEVQHDFYESSKNIDNISDKRRTRYLIKKLGCPDNTLEKTKRVLLKLSFCDSVEAYRAIEAYQKDAPAELKDWAIMAFQQSRMLIHSSLLGEQQFFISTGLGGKKKNLRYFVVFPYTDRKKPMEIQESMLKKELDFNLNEVDGELEDIQFFDEFATATILLPIKTSIGDIMRSVVDECNQYGDYLAADIVVTNMKKFSLEEINSFLNEDSHNKQ